MIIIILLITIAIYAYWKLTKHYSYWTLRGVKQRKQIYFLGDNASTVFRKESIFEMIVSIYQAFPEERYIGIYEGTLPTLVIRDPEIIKEVTVRKFDHFLNHRSFIPDGIDTLWSKNLSSLNDTEWRDMRSTLSPAFTSNKMKIIFSLMAECAGKYIDYFLKNDIINIELKDTLARYTNDVIATFGVECDSINEENNDFFVMGKKATTFTFFRTIKFLLYATVPELCKETYNNIRNKVNAVSTAEEINYSEDIMILLFLLAIIAGLLWKLKKHYNYWNDRGVKQNKQFYLLGDNAKVFFRRESFFDMMVRLYRTFPEERYVGIYQGMLPSLLIRDSEILKQITVKEFDHFLNHRDFVPEGSDPIWSRNLFALKDTAWRDMRSTLSPSFTSSKMKIIFTLMSDCAKDYLHYFKEKQGTIDIELKDTLTRYTNDVIATVAFGVNCDSINIKNNEFYLMGKKATTFGFVQNLKFFLYTIVPGISKWIDMKLFPEEVTNFFVKLIKDSIHIRETQGIVRPDMINLLLEARKGKKFDETSNIVDTGFATVEESPINAPPKTVSQALTDMDIAAQALIFFFAGFDSVATAMCFVGYELTINPDIQRRLQKEVDDTLKECNGKLTYEALLKMKYMDMVVSETLRKWPAAIVTDRVCSKPFTIDPVQPHEKPVHVKPGDVIFIAISGIHRDPRYYPNPDVFDPERFNDENKGNIKPYTYLPFGLGPRNCIGSRFALLEIKTIFFYLLTNFNLVVTKNTQVPIVLCKKTFNVLGENGMWIGLERRVT